MTRLQREAGLVERHELHPSNFDVRAEFERRVAIRNAQRRYDEPLYLGGQGRDAEDVDRAGMVCGLVLIALSALVGFYAVLWFAGVIR